MPAAPQHPPVSDAGRGRELRRRQAAAHVSPATSPVPVMAPTVGGLNRRSACGTGPACIQAAAARRHDAPAGARRAVRGGDPRPGRRPRLAELAEAQDRARSGDVEWPAWLAHSAEEFALASELDAASPRERQQIGRALLAADKARVALAARKRVMAWKAEHGLTGPGHPQVPAPAAAQRPRMRARTAAPGAGHRAGC